MKYPHKDIESKWQALWEKEQIFRAEDNSSKEKFYTLVEFPYPSGAGLHVGHPRSYTALDIVSHKKRMEGKNVLFPMGWDAFGLPTENYAIKTGRPPAEITDENTDTFRRQLKSIGFGFDWSREVDTTDPAYYKWTQWIFLQFFKAGLAYKKKMAINWCPKDKIGLANEEVVAGKCERCGGPVEKREKEQWMIAITKYADRLLSDLDTVNYLPKIKKQQEDWIGKSEGAEIVFKFVDRDDSVTVFTTRPDTLFGVTYVVLAPEHPLVSEITTSSQKKEVETYVASARGKTDIERGDDTKEKTGVFTGAFVVNPANGEKVPVWIADYALAHYGTGAVMAVPAHDERDFAFAKKFHLPIRQVISPAIEMPRSPLEASVASVGAYGHLAPDQPEICWTGEGSMVNSGDVNGIVNTEAGEKIVADLESRGFGKKTVQYKLRDWVFSRQRYWGEPIPLVHCETCEKKKYHFVFLHGFRGSNDTCFWPALREQLEKKGHTVFAPNLPGGETPSMDEWVEYVLKNTTFTEDTILVGHSLGTVAMQKLLPRLPMKIAKAVFVDGFVEPFFTDKKRPGVENATDWKFDYVTGLKNVSEVVVLGDRSETVIPREQNEKLAKAYGVSVSWRHPQMKHFCDADEPAVFGAVIPSGWIPLSDDQLPLTLPKVDKYQPTDTGESPLAAIESFVNTTCPRCGFAAKRETDTMPNWAGSSWYFLRYIDPKNDREFASPEKLKYWMPIDLYNGGMEHTTLHLLYSRFWNKFLYDLGYVPVSEPYARRHSHGLILAEDGNKMSKSKGNVVNPDEIVEEFGADTLRLYEMFMGPFEEPVPWSTNGVIGVRRFLERVYNLGMDESVWSSESSNKDLTRLLHKTVKKVTEDIEGFRFNTVVSSLMIFVNEVVAAKQCPRSLWETFLTILAPLAPHMAEECWAKIGHKESVFKQPWPQYDAALAKDDIVTLAVQVMGKLRDTIEISPEASEEEVKTAALALQNVQKHLEGKEVKKVIYVKGRMINFVI